MPESIPAPLIIDTLKDMFREARGTSTREPLGWILSVPDTHQKTVLAALDKEGALRAALPKEHARGGTREVPPAPDVPLPDREGAKRGARRPLDRRRAVRADD